MTPRPIPTVFKDVPKVAPAAEILDRQLLKTPSGPNAALSAVDAELRSVRRYEASVAIMAGFATSGRPGTVVDIANKSVEWADALLARLER